MTNNEIVKAKTHLISFWVLMENNNSSDSMSQQISFPIESTDENDEFEVEFKHSERINATEIQSENQLLEDQLEKCFQRPRDKQNDNVLIVGKKYKQGIQYCTCSLT